MNSNSSLHLGTPAIWICVYSTLYIWCHSCIVRVGARVLDSVQIQPSVQCLQSLQPSSCHFFIVYLCSHAVHFGKLLFSCWDCISENFVTADLSTNLSSELDFLVRKSSSVFDFAALQLRLQQQIQIPAIEDGCIECLRFSCESFFQISCP